MSEDKDALIYLADMRIDQLEAENTKLRELLVDMWEWMSRARYQRSVREEEMDELGARAVQLGIPDHWLGIEVEQ